jgi:hypothetical protein
MGVIQKLIAGLIKRRAKRVMRKKAVRLLKRSAQEGVQAVRASLNSRTKRR